MPRPPTTPRDVRASRPAKPYLPDGSLDPREWETACSAAGVLMLVVLRDKPWFVSAKPIEVLGSGVQIQVLVRWLSSEVWKETPWAVDGYPVDVVLDGETWRIDSVH
ncbi:MAG: hypothetical protein E6J85_17915 [Deltaproteobacteria bacterium]|nr:MAG: hypothetical protein E6J85_17915 [Deltaproteobacteria bacterium]